jgi:hypothetical protein
VFREPTTNFGKESFAAFLSEARMSKPELAPELLAVIDRLLAEHPGADDDLIERMWLDEVCANENLLRLLTLEVAEELKRELS